MKSGMAGLRLMEKQFDNAHFSSCIAHRFGDQGHPHPQHRDRLVR